MCSTFAGSCRFLGCGASCANPGQKCGVPIVNASLLSLAFNITTFDANGEPTPTSLMPGNALLTTTPTSPNLSLFTTAVNSGFTASGFYPPSVSGNTLLIAAAATGSYRIRFDFQVWNQTTVVADRLSTIRASILVNGTEIYSRYYTVQMDVNANVLQRLVPFTIETERNLSAADIVEFRLNQVGLNPPAMGISNPATITIERLANTDTI